MFAESLSHELARDEFLVAAVEGEELRVGSLLNDVTLLHHHDLVCIDDRTKSVGNDNDCESVLGKELIESFLDLVFTFGVKSTSGFIEEKDSWSSNKGASDSNSLLLATRKTTTSLADLGLEAIWEEDLVVKEAATRLFKSCFKPTFNLLITETLSIEAIKNVFTDGIGEESWLLLNNSELFLMIPPVVDFLDVLLVEEDFTSIWIVETLNQGDD